MIKQAMILAAGEGTRMRPLTLSTPKPLLTVGDKPLIVWHIEKLAAVGVTDIVVNARYLSDKLVAFFSEQTFGATVRLSLEHDFLAPIETAGGIKWALEQGFLKPEPFLLVNGDVWTDLPFEPLIQKDLADKWAHLCLIDNPAHNPSGDFLLSRDGLLMPAPSAEHNPSETTQGTPTTGESLTFSGISVLSPVLFTDTPIGEKAPLAPVLRSAISAGRVTGEKLSAKWVDVGTPERLSELDNFIKNQ